MNRHRIAVLIVVLGVLTAGCAGLTGDGDGTTTEGVTTSEGTDDPGDTTATTTAADDRDAEEVRADALAAMDAVETYRVAVEQDVVVSGPVTQRQTQSTTGVFDRPNREYQVDVTASSGPRTSQQSTWVVDRTQYSRSDSYVQQFGSRWVEIDVSGNFSRFWRFQDTMTRQRAVLDNATSLDLGGTETVNGTETRVLRADVSPDAYRDLAAGTLGIDDPDRLNITIHRANFTYYLATGTDLPVRSEAQINTTLDVRGQSIDQNVSFTVDYYGYGEPASIELPEAAESAVNLSNRTSRSLAPTADSGTDARGSAAPTAGTIPDDRRWSTAPVGDARPAGAAPPGHAAPVTEP